MNKKEVKTNREKVRESESVKLDNSKLVRL